MDNPPLALFILGHTHDNDDLMDEIPDLPFKSNGDEDDDFLASPRNK